jgi:hypothetical protein
MLRFNCFFRFRALASGTTPSQKRRQHEALLTTKILRETMIISMDEVLVSSGDQQQQKDQMVSVCFPPFNFPPTSSTNGGVKGNNTKPPTTFRLPLELALRFPLQGATEKELNLFKEELTKSSAFSPATISRKHQESSLKTCSAFCKRKRCDRC